MCHPLCYPLACCTHNPKINMHISNPICDIKDLLFTQVQWWKSRDQKSLTLHPCYCNTSHHLPWWVWTEEGKRRRAAHINPIQGGSSRWFRHNRETFILFHESWRYIQGLNKSPPDNLPLPMATWHRPARTWRRRKSWKHLLATYSYYHLYSHHPSPLFHTHVSEFSDLSWH